ncbi:hypothetical protein [Yersinia aldovae]|uniref:hypothetical protein n=2 Tax=Yersinia aldovae TaxID=29483 RepID=UPI0011A0A727|nr:hypothetical protein [Yersinia aldovae]
MFSRVMASNSDVVTFVTSRQDYTPQLSFLDYFIDFFINLMSGETKFQRLKDLHQDIFGDSTPDIKLGAMIALKHNTHAAFHKDFHAEILFGEDFFSTGKACVCFYYQSVLITQSEPIHYSTLLASQFSDHFPIDPLLLGNPIASFAKATAEGVVIDLDRTDSMVGASDETLDARLEDRYSERFELFTLGLDLLKYSGELPKEFKAEKYLKQLEELGKAVEGCLSSAMLPREVFAQIVSKINASATLILNDLCACLASTVAEKSKAFELSNFTDQRHNLAEQLITHLGQARYFYEGEFFASASGSARQTRKREIDIFDNTARLIQNFCTQGMFALKPGRDAVPNVYRQAVENTVDMLDCYCMHASEKGCFAITLESNTDYDMIYGNYFATRVCLRHDGVLKRKFNIPPEFEFLLTHHVVGELCAPVELGTSYRAYYLRENVTRNTFLSKVCAYFTLCEISSVPEKRCFPMQQ